MHSTCALVDNVPSTELRTLRARSALLTRAMDLRLRKDDADECMKTPPSPFLLS